MIQLQNPLLRFHKTTKGNFSGEDFHISPTVSFLDDSDSLAQIMPYGMAPSEFTERARSEKLFDNQKFRSTWVRIRKIYCAFIYNKDIKPWILLAVFIKAFAWGWRRRCYGFPLSCTMLTSCGRMDIFGPQWVSGWSLQHSQCWSQQPSLIRGFTEL